MKQQGSGGTAQRRARAGPRASARRTLRLGAVALAVLLLAAGAAGQPQPLSKERGLRDVRALLRAGGHQAAIALLEKLDAAYPNDSAIVEGLFQALVTVKAYQRAEEVMARFTRARPDDPRGPANLALVYLLMERRADALAALEKLIALKPAEAWPYQTAYQVLWERGASADATAMILRARAAVGDSALFALDAAQIYRSQAKLDSAAVEYVRAGAAGEDPGLAVDGVISIAEDPEDRRAVVASLERAALLPEAEEVARTCLWQLRLLDGDCAGAFGEVSALARRGRLSTGVLELFAARSKDLACYAECSEAYQLALGLSENKAQYPMLLLNKAGCEVAGGLADQAALTYGKVLEVHPNTKWACDAELALGTLARDRGLPDQAAGHADRVIASRAAGDRKFDAILFKGDCLTRGGNLDEAFKTYDQVGTDWRPDHAQEAFYNLGEIKFYQGGFDEAVSYYNVALRQYPEEPRANDSVERLLLVKAVKGDLGKTWLADFSRAALLERQGKTDEAVVLLKQLAADPGQGVIKTESLRRLAAIFAQRGEFDRAIRLYTQLGDTLVTAVSPNSLEAVGDIYAGLGRTPEAIAAYEQVIVKFPESVSAGEARRKIEAAKRKPE